MNIRTFLLCLVITVYAIPGYGQYGNHYHYRPARAYSSYDSKGKKWLKRQFIAVHLPSMNLELDSKYMTGASGSYGTGPAIDTAIFLNKKSSSSFGVSSGSFFPIARWNEKDMLAIEWSVAFMWYQFKYGKVYYSPVDYITDNASFLNVSMPIGLVYKNGGEVSLDPKNKVLFSFGGGFEPTFILGGYNSAGGASFKIRPYLMAELGMFFGIAAKIRATYYPGSVVMINDAGEHDMTGGSGNGQFSVYATGTNNFVLSLAILPYSFHWGDD